MQDPTDRALCVAVGSENPAKREAVRQALEQMDCAGFVLESVACEGLSDQPWGEAETRSGAIERARAARTAESADWGIGIEAGLVEDAHGVLVIGWVAAQCGDGRPSVVRSAAFYLPEALAERVRLGASLAEAWQQIERDSDAPHAGGTVGRLSKGGFERSRLYREAVALAVLLASSA